MVDDIEKDFDKIEQNRIGILEEKLKEKDEEIIRINLVQIELQERTILISVNVNLEMKDPNVAKIEHVGITKVHNLTGIEIVDDTAEEKHVNEIDLEGIEIVDEKLDIILEAIVEKGIEKMVIDFVENYGIVDLKAVQILNEAEKVAKEVGIVNSENRIYIVEDDGILVYTTVEMDQAFETDVDIGVDDYLDNNGTSKVEVVGMDIYRNQEVGIHNDNDIEVANHDVMVYVSKVETIETTNIQRINVGIEVDIENEEHFEMDLATNNYGIIAVEKIDYPVHHDVRMAEVEIEGTNLEEIERSMVDQQKVVSNLATAVEIEIIRIDNPDDDNLDVRIVRTADTFEPVENHKLN